MKWRMFLVAVLCVILLGASECSKFSDSDKALNFQNKEAAKYIQEAAKLSIELVKIYNPSANPNVNEVAERLKGIITAGGDIEKNAEQLAEVIGLPPKEMQSEGYANQIALLSKNLDEAKKALNEAAKKNEELRNTSISEHGIFGKLGWFHVMIAGVTWFLTQGAKLFLPKIIPWLTAICPLGGITSVILNLLSNLNVLFAPAIGGGLDIASGGNGGIGVVLGSLLSNFVKAGKDTKTTDYISGAIDKIVQLFRKKKE